MANTITEVRLLSVPLTNDYKHTYYFGSETEQANFFISKTVKSGDNFAYQRQDNVIRYPVSIDQLRNVNYVMYRNKAYTNKWFYAFITKMEYVNDNMTHIWIETDVIQTWLLKYTILPSFIEREHVDDDTVGLHTVPEQLETGDYVAIGLSSFGDLTDTTIIMGCTVDLTQLETSWTGQQKCTGVSGLTYNGVFSGVKYYDLSVSEAKNVIEKLAELGQSDGIVSMFMCPKSLINSTAFNDEHPNAKEVNQSDESKTISWDNLPIPVVLEDNYTPKNNKLLTYPYCYMLMTNNTGSSAVYKYELFDDKDKCSFDVKSALTAGMSITLIPKNYGGLVQNLNERLNLGKFPVCAWNTDVYTNWLTQNSLNMSVSAISAGIGLAVAPATGGLSAVATLGALSTIAGMLTQVNQKALEPPQAQGNVNSGDVVFASDNMTFKAYNMAIKKEYAEIIDGYFTMYGYKVNRFGIPDYDHRKSYWFTKTIDVSIIGEIPMDDLQKIKDCYNRGITFWKNREHIGDYSVSNEITGIVVVG